MTRTGSILRTAIGGHYANMGHPNPVNAAERTASRIERNSLDALSLAFWLHTNYP